MVSVPTSFVDDFGIMCGIAFEAVDRLGHPAFPNQTFTKECLEVLLLIEKRRRRLRLQSNYFTKQIDCRQSGHLDNIEIGVRRC